MFVQLLVASLCVVTLSVFPFINHHHHYYRHYYYYNCSIDLVRNLISIAFDNFVPVVVVLVIETIKNLNNIAASSCIRTSIVISTAKFQDLVHQVHQCLLYRQKWLNVPMPAAYKNVDI